jgi:hypothetical protein
MSNKNLVDLLFIVDVTGSMGGFIDAAKKRMQDVLNSLTEQFDIDLKVGFSFYRDHPPNASEFVTAIFDLMTVKRAQLTLNNVTVNEGGGNQGEAVLDGVVHGINGMAWRDNSRRIAFLIGDEPTLGMNTKFSEQEDHCPCGLTWGNAVVAAENNKVPIYSILLGSDNDAKNNFKLLSNFTGGFLIESDDAMSVILSTLKSEFDDINLDSKIIDMLSKNSSEKDICDLLNIDREKLEQSTSRIAQFY